MRQTSKNSQIFLASLALFCKLRHTFTYRRVDLMRAEGIKFNKGRGFIEFSSPD